MSPLRPRHLLGLLAAGALTAAVPAAAAPLPAGAVQIVSGPQAAATGYATTRMVSPVGSTVSFTNLDTTTHDVTSRKTRTVTVRGKKRQRPVFSTPITSSGGTRPVVGTASLKAGSYDFYCSLHPGMRGVLTVQ